MLKLYGVAISNYFATLKTALVIKEIPFEECTIMPGDRPEVLALSPMGKVPFIETAGGRLGETNVVFDYLEDIKPEPPLYPAKAWERAKAKEIIRVVELYLDAAVRPLLPHVYFGAPLDQRAAAAARPQVEKGLRAFKQLAHLDDYLAGGALGYADLSAWFQLGFTNLHTRKVYGWDIVDEVPGLGAYLERVRVHPAVDAVATEMETALAEVLPA